MNITTNEKPPTSGNVARAARRPRRVSRLTGSGLAKRVWSSTGDRTVSAGASSRWTSFNPFS